jgi:hypothetical protein
MTFGEFWPYYIQQHSKRGTRLLHLLGTTLLFVLLIGAVLERSAVLPLYGVLSAYGFAWAGHFLIEKNKPATFRHPFLSLLGDFKMYALMCTGRMDQEIRRLDGTPTAAN